MRYKIIIEPEAENDLLNIFNYIKKNDSEVKAKNFITKLQKSINSLSCKIIYYSTSLNESNPLHQPYLLALLSK